MVKHPPPQNVLMHPYGRNPRTPLSDAPTGHRESASRAVSEAAPLGERPRFIRRGKAPRSTLRERAPPTAINLGEPPHIIVQTDISGSRPKPVAPQKRPSQFEPTTSIRVTNKARIKPPHPGVSERIRRLHTRSPDLDEGEVVRIPWGNGLTIERPAVHEVPLL